MNAKVKYCLAVVLLCGSMCGTAGAKVVDSLSVVGEILTTAAFHSREGEYDRNGIAYVLPRGHAYNEVGQDLYDNSAIGTTVMARDFGVNAFCNCGGFGLRACINADMALTFEGDTKALLKQAYIASDFPLGKCRLDVLFGQEWHPTAIDRPAIASIDCGIPFNPYSVAPQLKLSCALPCGLGLEAAALWQSSYTSDGPAGYSVNYIRYAGIPEFYLGGTMVSPKFTLRAGAAYSVIKPRLYGIFPFTDVVVRTNDRTSSLVAFAYAGYRSDEFSIQAKATYNQGANHLGILGGYAATNFDSDYFTRFYSPFRTLAAWTNMSYGKRWIFNMFLGYSCNFGTTAGSEHSSSDVFFTYSAHNLKMLAKMAPSLSYGVRNFRFSLEYGFLAALEDGDEPHFIFDHSASLTALYHF